jgi:Na+/H+-dicarboxylate symporter
VLPSSVIDALVRSDVLQIVAFSVLFALAVSAVGLGPIGVAIIFDVDELMDMGRACVNVIGNCLATVVVPRWEKELDESRARVFGTATEAELDLKTGDVAFADAVAQGD